MENKQIDTMDLYQATYYISPYMYTSLEASGDKGRVIIFLFHISRGRDPDEKIETAQEYLKIIPASPFKESVVIGTDDLAYAGWAESIGTIANRNSIYIVPKVLPAGFWSMDEGFKCIFLEKITSSAMAKILNMTYETINTVELDVALSYAEPIDDAYVFKNTKTYSTIRIQKVQEPKKKTNKK